MSVWVYLAFACALSTLMSVRGYRKKSLNASGAALAFVVGLVSCTASVRLGLTLITFFVASSKATRIGAATKRKLEDSHQEGGNRNWVQVAANGGVGAALAACFRKSSASGFRPTMVSVPQRFAPSATAASITPR